MPLRDHFHPPLADFASWEELHGAWPGTIAFRLNTILPPEYRSGVRVHVGPAIEIDVAAYENDNPIGFMDQESVVPGNDRLGEKASPIWRSAFPGDALTLPINSLSAS